MRLLFRVSSCLVTWFVDELATGPFAHYLLSARFAAGGFSRKLSPLSSFFFAPCCCYDFCYAFLYSIAPLLYVLAIWLALILLSQVVLFGLKVLVFSSVICSYFTRIIGCLFAPMCFGCGTAGFGTCEVWSYTSLVTLSVLVC